MVRVGTIDINKILVTGAAGFIGSKLSRCLADFGYEVVGIDNINTYYDPNLKYGRLKEFYGIEISNKWSISSSIPETGNGGDEVTYPEMPFEEEFKSPFNPELKFVRLDIIDKKSLDKLFEKEHFDAVINLAAQAGVRYSINNPLAYVQSNVVGFTNILEACKHNKIKHFIYASSSSVYGGNTKVPFSEGDRVDHPMSLYAATKKSNELFAHVYSNLYKLPTTGLRFFTVYGPWGRPDMAPMLFTDAIKKGEPIKAFNNGNLSRDFTYIDDIIDGIISVISHIPDNEIPAEIYNIGRGEPMQLMDFIKALESEIGIQAELEMYPMQPGDVYTTYADMSKLANQINYKPLTTLATGIKKFVKWAKVYNYGE